MRKHMEENKMTQTEIQKRNLLSTVKECLQEHQVELVGTQGVVPMYLIEVGASSPLFKDFIDTYNGDIDNFKRKLAEKTLVQNPSNQMYGVLVDTDLQYAFAFNRQFADLNRQRQRIAFKGVEDILLEHSSGQDLSQVDMPEDSFPKFNGGGFDPGSTLIRYSITGKKGGKNNNENSREVSYERASLLDRIKTAYAKNEVKLKLDEDKTASFFLVTVPYETSRFADFMRTYDGEVDGFKEKLAKKTFGDGKVENQYGLLLTPVLQIQFAFNTQFGRYDAKSKSVIYTPSEEVLLGQTHEQKIDLSQVQPRPTSRPRPRRSGGPTVFRYALQGK
jgi:hypothetical protein